MSKNKQRHSTVSMAPAIYIQVAGGLKPALTKKSSVAGTVSLPTMSGMKKTAQIMRRMLNSLSRLKLSTHDIGGAPGLLRSDNSHFWPQPPSPILARLFPREL